MAYHVAEYIIDDNGIEHPMAWDDNYTVESMDEAVSQWTRAVVGGAYHPCYEDGDDTTVRARLELRDDDGETVEARTVEARYDA